MAKTKKAVELDPLNHVLSNRSLQPCSSFTGHVNTMKRSRKSARLGNGSEFKRSRTFGLGCAWSGKAKIAEARSTEFQKAATLDEVPWYRGSLGYTCAVLAIVPKQSRSCARWKICRSTAISHLRMRSRRSISGLAKRKKLSIGWKRPLRIGIPPLWIGGDQLYDSLRDEPHFKALLQKLNVLKEAAKQ